MIINTSTSRRRRECREAEWKEKATSKKEGIVDRSSERRPITGTPTEGAVLLDVHTHRVSSTVSQQDKYILYITYLCKTRRVKVLGTILANEDGLGAFSTNVTFGKRIGSSGRDYGTLRGKGGGGRSQGSEKYGLHGHGAISKDIVDQIKMLIFVSRVFRYDAHVIVRALRTFPRNFCTGRKDPPST
jgi:hypothetical protein